MENFWQPAAKLNSLPYQITGNFFHTSQMSRQALDFWC